MTTILNKFCKHIEIHTHTVVCVKADHDPHWTMCNIRAENCAEAVRVFGEEIWNQISF